MSEVEGEWVLHLFGRRVRLYLGHSIYESRRIRVWGPTDLGTRGVYVVPWRDRVVGLQWRPKATRDRFDRDHPTTSEHPEASL